VKEFNAILHFNDHFPGQSGLAGTRMSPFWILLELRMMEGVVTTGAIRRAKCESYRHHQQTNTQSFFTGQMPFLSPNQWCRGTEGKSITFHGLDHPKLTWGSSSLVFKRWKGLYWRGKLWQWVKYIFVWSGTGWPRLSWKTAVSQVLLLFLLLLLLLS